jgi:hypothetical protein
MKQGTPKAPISARLIICMTSNNNETCGNEKLWDTLLPVPLVVTYLYRFSIINTHHPPYHSSKQSQTKPSQCTPTHPELSKNIKSVK